MVGVGLGVTAQDQGSAVGGWEVDVEHLDGGKLVEHGSRGEPCGERAESGAQGDVETIGEEGDEDVRFDTLDQLIVDRTQPQIALEVLERRLDLGELDIESPQLGRLASAYPRRMEDPAVSAADPSGLFGMLKESMASARALVQAKADPSADELVKAVEGDFETSALGVPAPAL